MSREKPEQLVNTPRPPIFQATHETSVQTKIAYFVYAASWLLSLKSCRLLAALPAVAMHVVKLRAHFRVGLDRILLRISPQSGKLR